VKLICLCGTVIVCDEGYLESVRVYCEYCCERPCVCVSNV